MPINKQDLIHANSLQLDRKGILIMGETGTGKSLLTLTLLERAHLLSREAHLVADDYTYLDVQEGRLKARTPQTIRGAMEIRGAGLFAFPFRSDIVLDLAVELTTDAPRYPDTTHFEYGGVKIPLLRLPRLDEAPLLAVCHALEAHLFLSPWVNAAGKK